VKVLPIKEIEKTLDLNQKTNGLWFMRNEKLLWNEAKVLRKVNYIFDERPGAWSSAAATFIYWKKRFAPEKECSKKRAATAVAFSFGMEHGSGNYSNSMRKVVPLSILH